MSMGALGVVYMWVRRRYDPKMGTVRGPSLEQCISFLQCITTRVTKNSYM